jgi:hypothetical protein
MTKICKNHFRCFPAFQVTVVCTVKYADRHCVYFKLCQVHTMYHRLKQNIYLEFYIVKKTRYISRQAEYLHQQAMDYQNTYGIDQWWIGLTDFGKFF